MRLSEKHLKVNSFGMATGLGADPGGDGGDMSLPAVKFLF